MALYQKVDGVWTLCQRPYVKRNGIWVAADEVWYKQSGSWNQVYNYDVTPPAPPEITLNIVEDFVTQKGEKSLRSRWIRVGVRLPGASNDIEARRARVLTSDSKPPVNHEGGFFTSSPDKSYPDEPWSEWRYNDFGTHKDSSVVVYKEWPLNASGTQIIKGDTTYYFAGWAQDDAGNWSIDTQAQIHVPKSSVNVPNVITKEAYFQPNTSGSWRNAGYQTGDVVQQNSPRSVGIWFYGNQITDSVGAQTSGDEKVTIKNAQIWMKRQNDNGAANANVYLYWTDKQNPAALPAPGSGIGKTEITKIGTIAKGEGKWFDLPSSFYGDLNKNIKSIGLDFKDPTHAGAGAADSSVMVSTATNNRSGQVHLVWEEEL